jgi:hypothetical protein
MPTTAWRDRRAQLLFIHKKNPRGNHDMPFTGWRGQGVSGGKTLTNQIKLNAIQKKEKDSPWFLHH